MSSPQPKSIVPATLPVDIKLTQGTTIKVQSEFFDQLRLSIINLELRVKKLETRVQVLEGVPGVPYVSP